MKTGLVLEGGGMRGTYTVGVLDCLMENAIQFPYCIGVSAGAANGISYVSGQKGRSLRINTGYLHDKRYLSLHNFIRTGSFFGMDFIFGEIPNRLDPFNYDAFFTSPCDFVTGVTDVWTGKPAYFGKDAFRGRDSTVLKASAAIPGFSRPVSFQGGIYLDGGTADPIPVRRALADGCDRLVVVLTHHRGFVKKPEKCRPLYHSALRRYPKMVELLDCRHEIYQSELRELARLEREGVAVVVAPSRPIHVNMFDKNPATLQNLWSLGKNDTLALLPGLSRLAAS